MLNYFEHQFNFHCGDEVIGVYYMPDIIVDKPIEGSHERFEQLPATKENWFDVLEGIFNVITDDVTLHYKHKHYNNFRKFFAACPDAQVIVEEEYSQPWPFDLKKILEYPYPYEALALLRDHLTDFSLDKLTPIDYNKVVEWNRKASEDENDSSTV